MTTINIGDLLRAFGVITEDELRCALVYQRHQPHLKLGQILVKKRFATQRQINDCLAKQTNLSNGLKPQDVARLADYAASELIDESTDLSDILDTSELPKGKT